MGVAGVTFTDASRTSFHTWTDLGLVLSNVGIAPAVPKTNFVDLPGGNGSVDLTEALGRICYNDREVELVFTLMPGPEVHFDSVKRKVMAKINGGELEMALDRDPGVKYKGRFWVNDYATDGMIKQITINGLVSPYMETGFVEIAKVGQLSALTWRTVTNSTSLPFRIALTGRTDIAIHGNTNIQFGLSTASGETIVPPFSIRNDPDSMYTPYYIVPNLPDIQPGETVNFGTDLGYNKIGYVGRAL